MRDDAVTTFICLKSCLWLEFSNFLLNTSDALLLFVKIYFHWVMNLIYCIADICQKLSADVKQREWLVACNSHRVCINYGLDIS